MYPNPELEREIGELGKVFYHCNFVKFILYCTRKEFFLCMCAQETDIYRVIVIPLHGSEEIEKPDPASLEILTRMLNCTTPHMFFSHQSVLVEIMKIPLFV